MGLRRYAKVTGRRLVEPLSGEERVQLQDISNRYPSVFDIVPTLLVGCRVQASLEQLHQFLKVNGHIEGLW